MGRLAGHLLTLRCRKRERRQSFAALLVCAEKRPGQFAHLMSFGAREPLFPRVALRGGGGRGVSGKEKNGCYCHVAMCNFYSS